MADLMEQINQILGQKKEKKEEKVNFVKEFRRLDSDSVKTYPQMEVRFIMYLSDHGVHVPRDKKETLAEGIVPITGNPERLEMVANKLEEMGRRSELDKYRRIKKQSDLLIKKKAEGKDADEFVQIFPPEYDIDVVCVPLNKTRIHASFKIFTNNPEDIEEFENELEHYRDRAMDEILKEKIRSLSQ